MGQIKLNFRRLKRKTALILALAMVIGACSCTSPEPSGSKKISTTGTPETTEAPPADVNSLFPMGDKDYFVPFQDPEHSYCTISDGLGTPVREQGWGGCYCYAAVSTMQSNYLKKKGVLIDINPVDIINRVYGAPDPVTGEVPGYDEEKIYIRNGLVTDLGGDVQHVVMGLCADPLNGYIISEANIFGCYNCDREGIYSISENDIKSAIKKYGAICLGVNYTRECKMVNGYYTQNHANAARDTNHVATIVGWDDNFPADCFKTPATRNGAWLVQNSFGEIWGNMGFYWVSYDTPIPELYNCVVTTEYKSGISYGKFTELLVLSPDALEKVGPDLDSTQVTCKDITSCNNVTYATVYDKKGTVGAVGIWADVPGTPYEIEVLEGEFGKVLATAKGTFERAGYLAVKLDNPVKVKKFTVVVKTAGNAFFEGESHDTKVYKAIGYAEAHYEVKTEPGRSFVKVGDDWVDVTDPKIMERMGIADVSEYAKNKTPGDPCITVLFV